MTDASARRPSPPPHMQRALRAVFGTALHVFYRHESFGRDVPGDGPLILVANHPNGLVDPIMLATTTRRAVRFLSKAPLFEMPLIGSIMRGFRALPVYRSQDGADTSRNDETFEAVFEALRSNDLVCLFPEGTSHSEPTLLELKTGAARMALGAEASRSFELGVRIVPVGLVYRAKRRFRSRVATCIGEPIHVADLASLHASDDRAAVRALTERIADGLRNVTLTLDRWEDLPMLEFAAQLFRPDEADRLTYLHEFADRAHALRLEHPEAVAQLTDRVTAFKRRLERLGLSPENLHSRYRPAAVARFCAWTLISLLITLPLALVGAVYWAPPYLLTPRFPAWLRASRDTHATIQLLAGLLLFPAWWVASIALALHFTNPLVASVTAAASIPLGFLALAYSNWRTEAAGNAATFLRLWRRRRLRELLIQERAALIASMADLRPS